MIQVKVNQPMLLEQIMTSTSDDNTCVDSFREIISGRGRIEIRDTFLYKNLAGISPDWTGLKWLTRVERTVWTKKKQSRETAYCISDISSNKAAFFARHIRNLQIILKN